MKEIINNDYTTYKTMKEIIVKAIENCRKKGWHVPREYTDILDYIEGAIYYMEKRHKEFLTAHPGDKEQGKMEWWL